jgi:hypothetical protein
MTAIEQALLDFRRPDGWRLRDFFSPADIRKLAELIREHINHEGE